ncbi:homogentisate 1,2-dioxygenase isoform X3 [Elaeis guineensis]|uniref:homogentisate 1,2-dioxygenase isoform X3 n=1 Tax=Elaeis guineensis var. tenera TaxID=51953 RepID=UPI003C6D37F8
MDSYRLLNELEQRYPRVYLTCPDKPEPTSGGAGLWITTECGKLQVSPGEIVVLPGFCFAIKLSDCRSHGYVTKVFGIHFQLPELGPIGIALMSVSLCQWSDFSKGLSCSHSLV